VWSSHTDGNVFWYYSLTFILVSSPTSPSSPQTVPHFLSLSMYIWLCMYLCIHLSFGSNFHIWEKTCALCPSEPGLLCLPFIFPQTTWFHSSLWLKNTPCVCIPHFLNLFTSCRACGLIHSSPVVYSASINRAVQVSLLFFDLHSFGYVPESGIARLW
jgi:hypothetical protein